MTRVEFLAFYPHFRAMPDVVLDAYVGDANRRFSDMLDAAEDARRLYTAHKLTLYAKSVPSSSGSGGAPATVEQIAAAGSSMQATSKSVGGVSVSLSEGSGVGAIRGFGEWKTTVYGVQLIALVRASLGMVYVP